MIALSVRARKPRYYRRGAADRRRVVHQLNTPTLSTELARWAASVTFEDLPDDVVAATKLRVMDVIGLALAGAETDFGRSVRAAALALSTPGPCRILGFGDRVGVTTAAFANGAFSQALEFDDTHNESIVHMSSPAVAAALALSEYTPVSGRDLITAIAIGNEISCRVGSVSSGELHRRGFHPTGLFATFGAAYLAGKIAWARRRSTGPRGGDRGQLCVRIAGVLGGWNANQVPASRDGRRKAESQRRCWRARASRVRRRSSKAASACSLRTCRIRTRIATSRESMTGWASIGRAAIRPSSRFPPRT